ncbi:MAG: hypothetical protein KGI80_02855 [Verrucomicrobiota bacterium]|nr:hypothetical protein [Verrucomicrobiota bacterium]
MKPKKRQKLCFHCEGEVDLDVIVCPFCAADLREERPASFRPPPPPISQVQTKVFPESSAEEQPQEENGWIPVVFFTAGLQLFLFGLFTLFFSEQGEVTLHWNAACWFFYCLIGGPLLYFGYKKL